MKLIRNILLIATGLSMASCNYLDVNTDTKDRMSLEEVFTDETYTEQWLANAYSYLTNSEFADISITGSNPFNFSDDIYNPIYKSFKEVTYGESNGRIHGNTVIREYVKPLSLSRMWICVMN